MAYNADPKLNGKIDLMREIRDQIERGDKNISDRAVQGIMITALISIIEGQCRIEKVAEYPSFLFYLRYFPIPTVAVSLVAFWALEWLYQQQLIEGILRLLGLSV